MYIFTLLGYCISLEGLYIQNIEITRVVIMTNKKTELTSIKIERVVTIVLIIFNIIFLVFNYFQTKRSNDINELSQIRSYQIEETKLNLDLLNSFVIDLQNSRQHLDMILHSSNYNDYKKELEEMEDSTQNIFNTIRTKLDDNNKYSDELYESFENEIDITLTRIENIRKQAESEDDDRISKVPLVNTGYIPKLEDDFMRYKSEELNLMLKKLDKDNN